LVGISIPSVKKTYILNLSRIIEKGNNLTIKQASRIYDDAVKRAVQNNLVVRNRYLQDSINKAIFLFNKKGNKQ
jgi:hypothetical protein